MDLQDRDACRLQPYSGYRSRSFYTTGTGARVLLFALVNPVGSSRIATIESAEPIGSAVVAAQFWLGRIVAVLTPGSILPIVPDRAESVAQCIALGATGSDAGPATPIGVVGVPQDCSYLRTRDTYPMQTLLPAHTGRLHIRPGESGTVEWLMANTDQGAVNVIWTETAI